MVRQDSIQIFLEPAANDFLDLSQGRGVRAGHRQLDGEYPLRIMRGQFAGLSLQDSVPEIK